MSKSDLKRVLIVSYYWPPSGGSGVQRWLKLSKYLSDYGWKAVIYTPENPDFNIQDESLLKDISSDVEVVKRKIFEPYGIARLITGKKKLNTGLVTTKKEQGFMTSVMNWIRGNVFVPDPRVLWVRPSVKFLKNYVRDNPVDAIITTGPPHSMHLIGKGLKAKLNLPWIVDIRDPFSQLDFLDTFNLSESSKKRYEKIESAILNRCDQVVATSYSMPEMLLDFDRSKFTTITNGYDKDDFEGIDFSRISTETIRLYHAGLLNELRNPKHLWGAIAQWNSDNDKKMLLHLCGTIDGRIQENLKSNLIDNVQIDGYKSHDEVISDYQNADVLILLINQSKNSKVNIPGKLFEYLATGKTIIGIGKKDDDAIKILSDLGFSTFDYEEPINKIQLETAIAFKPSSTDISKYSRRSTAQQLSLTLNKLIGQHA